MEVTNIQLTHADDWIDPTINIQIRVEHKQDRVPIITGGKMTVDDTVLTNISVDESSFESVLMADNSVENVLDREQSITGRAKLSERAIDHIEQTRRRNSKGNFNIEIEFDGYTIRSNLYISSLHEADESISYQNGDQEGNPMVYDEDRDIHPARWDQWILSAKEASALIIKDLSLNQSQKIYASDWREDFLNEFYNEEHKTISYSIKYEGLPDELENAWNHLDEAEEKLRKHEDKGVAASCRDAFHAVKKTQETLKEEVGEKKWDDASESANAVKDLGLHTVQRGEEEDEEFTLADAEMVLNTMRNFVTFASRHYPSAD